MQTVQYYCIPCYIPFQEPQQSGQFRLHLVFQLHLIYYRDSISINDSESSVKCFAHMDDWYHDVSASILSVSTITLRM